MDRTPLGVFPNHPYTDIKGSSSILVSVFVYTYKYLKTVTKYFYSNIMCLYKNVINV